eukprot:gnl/Spiro4/2003_TR959_c0_g1_i1.p2 gnl/Spiro4/2003_TR959_c0_g1~~gnl/Spiro4/2003_TR959_c0_g1_i1.p2  ORF type:complete len:166 (-),score=20.70 gnl/Spiro4/2003_TR959_c0_g1_i1:219-716(-)
MRFIRNFVETRILGPLRNVLMSGLSPWELALSVVLGIVCGLFPIPGLTSLVSLLAVVSYKPLNVVVVQVVNLCLTPIQIACIPLFVVFGEWIFPVGPDEPPFSVVLLTEALAQSVTTALDVFKTVFLRAVVGWLPLAGLAIVTIGAHSLLRGKSTEKSPDTRVVE